MIFNFFLKIGKMMQMTCLKSIKVIAKVEVYIERYLDFLIFFFVIQSHSHFSFFYDKLVEEEVQA